MNPDISIFHVRKIDERGTIVSAIEIVQDFQTRQVLTEKPIGEHENHSFEVPQSEGDELNLHSTNLSCEDEEKPNVTLVKLESSINDENDPNPGMLTFFFDQKSLNIPTMIRCQNCETNFPTKYQYQRHQCEFNAEKVVLKPNADLKDINKGMRIKYDCDKCGKQFVSKNNLERHLASHDNTKDNICEHCNKQFVSENRLRIHKENHCKKVGDISKFYRSDVAVWKCKKCHEVFSSIPTASAHVEQRQCDQISNSNNNNTNSNNNSINNPTNILNSIDKINTEILLQCEYCNRTYANKELLLSHQKTHTTEKNYECVNCGTIFESYAMAAQHWLKICSETTNTFYLPKLTYCEYCDRTFKSHELLYTHKIKKKHYTLKLHNPKFNCDETTANGTHENSGGSNNNNSEVINKLIEDVLLTLERPLTNNNNNNNSNSNNMSMDIHVKEENVSPSEDLQTSMIAEELIITDDGGAEGTKKKRGRKRKLKLGTKPTEHSVSQNGAKKIELGYKFQCERCITVWDSVNELERHRETEHAASFNCEDCGQVLHSAKALLIHSRAHKCLKPYVCDTCGRSYSQTSHLWQHMRFHQGIKPFACPHEGCEARYTIRPDLKDHIRKVHTRERPFKCTVCNKCFLTGSVYYQHRLIHTNDRRYGCDVCHKRFFRADALNNHKRIHTDERPYPCTVCGREFRQKGDRNKHLRTQHPDAIVQQ